MIHFNIILLSNLRSSKWSLPLNCCCLKTILYSAFHLMAITDETLSLTHENMEIDHTWTNSVWEFICVTVTNTKTLRIVLVICDRFDVIEICISANCMQKWIISSNIRHEMKHLKESWNLAFFLELLVLLNEIFFGRMTSLVRHKQNINKNCCWRRNTFYVFRRKKKLISAFNFSPANHSRCWIVLRTNISGKNSY
jgi:hypothetical protein